MGFAMTTPADLARVRTVAGFIVAAAEAKLGMPPGQVRVELPAPGPLEVHLPEHGTAARGETCSCTRCKRAVRWGVTS